MIVSLTNLLSEKPQYLNLRGGNLLYKVDVSLEAARLTNSLVLSGLGQARLGPKRLSGQSSSQYILKGTAFRFKSHNLECGEVRFSEAYEANEEGVVFKRNNKNPKLLKSQDQSFCDPLLILFYLSSLDTISTFNKESLLVAGGKIKRLKLEKRESKLDFFVNDKVNFSGQIKASEILLSISKLKIKLKLSRLVKD